MKTLSPGLVAHVQTGVTTLCWCWRLTRADGIRLGFTDHDRNLSFDDTLFEAAAGFTASDIKSTVGLNVDNLDVTGALSSEALNEADLAAALFDDAQIEIWRVNWANHDERVLMRTGSIGEVSRSDTVFTAEIRGLAHYLNQQQGRSFQYNCDATLGDQRCGVALNDAAFQGSGAVIAVDTAYRFLAGGLGAFAADWFSSGLITWLSGPNAGRAMEVKYHGVLSSGAVIELWQPMSAGIDPGDGFTITAGCDKTFATCRAKFANGLNFRGFPHMPGNDYVLSQAASGEGNNDGGVIVP